MVVGWRGVRRGAVVVVVAALAVEGLLRWVLFGEGDVARGLAERFRLRRAELYAASWEDDYWRLRHRFGQTATEWNPNPDPELGWLSTAVEPGTLAHQDEASLAGRRPVLLFGDSYAQCVVPSVECWQGLLEVSPLGRDLRLLNYGTGGYGFDQTVMLCRRVVPRFAERDPLVVVSVLVDDDLDRSLLEVRGWPKPRFRVDAEGRCVPDGRSLPTSRAEFLSDLGLSARSYLWSTLVHGTHLLPWRLREGDGGARWRELEALNRALLRDLVADLERTETEHFFLLFHGWAWMGEPSAAVREREALLVDELRATGTHWVSARSALERDAGETGRGLADYFLRGGRFPNHYTALGNEVVFRALRAGLEGSFEE